MSINANTVNKSARVKFAPEAVHFHEFPLNNWPNNDHWMPFTSVFQAAPQWSLTAGKKKNLEHQW